MTHEFMAMMLGVRRPGVSLAAGLLQKAGLIQLRPRPDGRHGPARPRSH